MAAATGLVVIKRFLYKGASEDWSNKYWFTGSPPADDIAWKALFDALVAQEKTVYPAEVTVVGGYGYDDDDPDANAVYHVDMTVSPNTPVAGTQASAGGQAYPGDAAGWVRWKTSRTNEDGKPIYLRKYFHGMLCSGAGFPDNIKVAQVTSMTAFGTKLFDGSFLSGRKITGQGHTDVILNTGASTYITTRTLKRRGKRPGS